MKKIFILFSLILFLVSCGDNKDVKIENTDSEIVQVKIEDVNSGVSGGSSEIGKPVDNVITEKIEKVTKKELVDKLDIDSTEHYDKYELDCDSYNGDDSKKYCWETKIESHLFYLFRGYELDEKYSIKCSDVFSEEKWSAIPDLAKEYIGKCEDVMAPHYEMYKEKLKEIEKEEIIKKNAENFELSKCNTVIIKEYSEETKEKQEDLLSKCRIGFIVKNEKSCNELNDQSEINQCDIIKKDIEEYENFLRIRSNYTKYNNVNFESFIKGNWVRKDDLFLSEMNSLR